MGKLTCCLIIALFVAFLSACDDGSTESSSPLNVFIAVDPDVSTVGNAITVTVIAENPTDSAIEFGTGSSSCQLTAVVRFNNQDYSIASNRVCLTDYVVHSLDPGEQISENWIWYGEIYVDGAPQPLPVGTYEIRGAAGQYNSSPAIVDISQ